MDWDRQWKTDAEYLDWIGELCAQWQRILKPNGSLYAFASPKMAARVECKAGEWFNVLNRIRWLKEAGWHNKAVPENLRSYLSPWEEIIFAEHFGADSAAKGESGYGAKCDELRGFVFEPLRAYLAGEFKRAGVPFGRANDFCGTASMAARHYFARSQWCLPTKEHYKALQQGLNTHGAEYLRRDYEYLRRDYEELRRPFTVTADMPYSDLWTWKTVPPYPGKHPCEKPLAMMEHIVKASSRPDDVVLDCCMGSGNTGVAALRNGRRFIGVDMSEHWCEVAREKLARPVQAGLL